ncbi:MAG: rhodanese-like domain-containing protein [Ghiorsea sp.]|nr:rhodanese-like domain-containing protein [Ghiorsea sp.]
MIRSVIAVLFISLFISSCDMGEPKGYTIISVNDAYELVKSNDTNTVFLDVRSPSEYQSGHVPNAKLIPVQKLSSRLNEVPKDKNIVVYCEAGVRAAKAADILVEAGFTNVQSMKASMRGWRSAGYPLNK